MSREDLYIWCGRRICQQREDDGATVVRNYYRQGFAAGEDTFVYVRDHLDSVQAVVGEDGETFESARRYSPWGETRETSGAGEASDFGYTGHLDHGPSGVVLAQYRGYDARLGRWLSRDPIAERGGLNIHAYVLNDPIMLMDPRGLDPLGLAWVTVEFAEQWWEKRKDTKKDKYHHCLANCHSVEEFPDGTGELYSDLLSEAKECLDGLTGSNTPLQSEHDRMANETGQNIAYSGGDCESGCASAFLPPRPGW